MKLFRFDQLFDGSGEHFLIVAAGNGVFRQSPHFGEAPVGEGDFPVGIDHQNAVVCRLGRSRHQGRLGVDFCLLSRLNGLHLTDNQHLQKVEQAENQTDDGKNPQMLMIGHLNQAGDVLIELENSNDLTVLDNWHIGRHQIDLLAYTFMGTEFTAVGQFADDFAITRRQKALVITFIFTNLRRIRGKHRDALKVIEFDLGGTGRRHHRRDFFDQ
jgi:hypothetical protein